jgi:hypothetical protein
MRTVTIQTANIIEHRPVHPIFFQGRVHRALVACPAQLSGLPLGFERRGPLVTLRTLSFANGGVGHVKDDTSTIGAMRVVAGNAVLIRYRVIHVRSFEREFFNLMTLFTEGGRIPFQQEIGFGRRMWIMAIKAAFPLV